MRRLGLVVVLLLAFAAAPSGGAKTVDWREQKQVADGVVRFHVTKIVIVPARWSVTLSITNRTGAAVRLTTPAQGTTPIPHLSLLTRTQYRGETALVYTGRDGRQSRAYDPSASQLPSSIAKGETWTGTISGRGRMAHGRYVLGLGWFEPRDSAAGGQGFYWITDHSIRW